MKKKIAKLGIMCLVAGALLLPKESNARDTDYTTGAFIIKLNVFMDSQKYLRFYQNKNVLKRVFPRMI